MDGGISYEQDAKKHWQKEFPEEAILKLTEEIQWVIDNNIKDYTYQTLVDDINYQNILGSTISATI